MLLQALFYFDSGDQIFLTALLSVIYISDSTMLMQEIVISFEEVTQTKLTVKLRISQSSTQSLNIVRDLLFKQRFSSLTLDLSRGFVVFET